VKAILAYCDSGARRGCSGDNALFAYIALITVNQFVTVPETYTLATIFRGVLFAATVILLVAHIHRISPSISLWPLAFWLVYSLWGLAGAAASGSVEKVSDNALRDFFLTGLGVAIISSGSRPLCSDRVARLLLAYFLILFLITVWFGGFTVDQFPRFDFSRASDSFGSDISYSLGTSNLYSLASLTAASLWSRSGQWVSSAVLLTLCLSFMFLALLGGARGESVVLLLLLAGIFLYSVPKASLFCMAIIAVAAFFHLDFSSIVEGFVLFNRLSEVADGYLGSRDDLLISALKLIQSNPGCLIAGCGAGYFQHYFDFVPSMYPHNIIAEWVITFGVVSFACVSVVALKGVSTYLRSTERIDLFWLFYLYSLAVNMKSGGLSDSWFTVSATIYFFALGVAPRAVGRSRLAKCR